MDLSPPLEPRLALFGERSLMEIIRAYGLDKATASRTAIAIAEEHFDLIGVGGHAAIFAHPDDDSLAIRITDYPDGWFAYAADVMERQNAYGIDSHMRFAPVVHEIAICDRIDAYLAVTERLTHRTDTFAERLVNQVRLTRDFRYGSPGAVARLEALDEQQPGIWQFMDEYWFTLVDLHPGNIMFRGETLIFNDPRGRPLRNDEIARLEAAFGFNPAPGSRDFIRYDV
ncbi:MAG: hypothetical protein K2X45_19280 [Phreatobacter sp.]|nr:hypothetical protein [Phreatobacter sp.]